MVGWTLVQVVVRSSDCARSRTASEEANKGYPARTSMELDESGECEVLARRCREAGVGVGVGSCKVGRCFSGRCNVLSVGPPETSRTAGKLHARGKIGSEESRPFFSVAISISFTWTSCCKWNEGRARPDVGCRPGSLARGAQFSVRSAVVLESCLRGAGRTGEAPGELWRSTDPRHSQDRQTQPDERQKTNPRSRSQALGQSCWARQATRRAEVGVISRFLAGILAGT